MKIKKIIDCNDFYALITNHKNPLVYLCEADTYYFNDDVGQERTITDDNQINEWLLLTELKNFKKIK